jgi:protein TonB
MTDWQHYEGKTWNQKYWETYDDVPFGPPPKPKPPGVPKFPPPQKPDPDLVEKYKKYLDELEKNTEKFVPWVPSKPKPKPKPKPKKKRKPKAEKVAPPPPHDDTIEERQI